MKNYAAGKSDIGQNYVTKDGSFIHEAPLDSGIVDIPYCLRRLTALGYNGAHSFETGNTPEVEKQNLEYVKRILGLIN